MFDPELFGQAMGEAIKKAVAPLREKIAALEQQLAERPDFAALVSAEVGKAIAGIPVPRDGKDADMQQVKAWIADAVKALPAPKDGKDAGPDAVKALVQEAVAALPKPQDGKSLTVEDVRHILNEAIKQLRADADEAIKEPLQLAETARDALLKAVGELRQPEDGKSVTIDDLRPLILDAVKSIREEALERIDLAVKALPAPKDGIGVAGAMIDRDGCLQITLSNGEVKALGVVVGKDGADLSDASFTYDGERTLTIEGKGGSVTKRLPIPMDKGYWRDGMSAEKGDIVTHDGNAWIALQDTRERPGHGAKDAWRLFARRGRDGESVVREVSAGPAKPIKLGA